ncbi:hypothetical protein E2C01_019990 [Portunus trituberculatus]|uniref:Uncharacterized protein n=1 Tax=Portunus trituberculatus TaxID=210409 RepID=A0A5B7E0A6_PORTR|nr:hypothetical protein [Portunus trituberculatus]
MSKRQGLSEEAVHELLHEVTMELEDHVTMPIEMPIMWRLLSTDPFFKTLDPSTNGNKFGVFSSTLWKANGPE